MRDLIENKIKNRKRIKKIKKMRTKIGLKNKIKCWGIKLKEKKQIQKRIKKEQLKKWH